MANITENLRKMKIACSLKETQTILTKARENLESSWEGK